MSTRPAAVVVTEPTDAALAFARAEAQRSGRPLELSSASPATTARATPALLVTGSVDPPGSSAADLVDVQVVTVPTGWTGPEHGCVVVGVDPVRPNLGSLCTAVTRARLAHAVLRVVVVTQTPSLALRRDVEELAASCGSDGCETEVVLYDGSAANRLIRASRSADLLVVGRERPAHPDGPRLGYVGARLLREAACPVLWTEPWCGTKVPARAAS